MTKTVTDDDMLSIGNAIRIVSQNSDMTDVQRRAKWLQDVLRQRGYEIVKRGSVEPSDSDAAKLDRTYCDGARAAQGIAHQSLVAMDDWIAKGCGNRRPSTDDVAKRVLEGAGLKFMGGFDPDEPAVKSREPTLKCLVAGCSKPVLVAEDGAVGGLCKDHNGTIIRQEAAEKSKAFLEMPEGYSGPVKISSPGATMAEVTVYKDAQKSSMHPDPGNELKGIADIDWDSPERTSDDHG